MKACIIANGVLPPLTVVKKIIASADIIVYADGGANHAAAIKIIPHVIIGDLDSITLSSKRFYKNIPILRITEQHSTDLEKAIIYCIRQKCDSVDILGATGGRIDHTVGNLGCFKKFGKRIFMRMIEAGGELSLIQKKVELKTRKGRIFSLIPLDRCTGVTTKNLKYPLRNNTLELGIREGTSNRATAGHVSISVKRGTLLLYKAY